MSRDRKGRSETSPYFLNAFELDGVSLVGGELGDVEAVVVDEQIVRVDEDGLLRLHGLEFAGVGINRSGAGDVRDDAEFGIEHGKKAAAVAVLGPVVGEVREEIVVAVAADLAGLPPGSGVRPRWRPSSARRRRYCWSLIAIRSVGSESFSESIMPPWGPQWAMPPLAPPKTRMSFPSVP